jgi:hypothetical protein
MRISEVIKALEFAKDNCLYGYVEVTIPGQNATEIIINDNESLDNKISYYQKAYNEDGVHNMNENIRIVSAGGLNELKKVCYY